MRSRFATFVIAASLSGPTVTTAAARGAEDAQDARVRVQSRTVIQAQRERDRQRVTRGGHDETERTSRTIRIGGNGELLLSNLSGDITVTRGSGSDAQIEVVKVARGRNADDAREMLSLVRVDITERGSRVEARAVYPSAQQLSGQQRRNLSVSVNYIVTVPAGTRLVARTLSGDVKITGIRGEISAQSTSGHVAISGAERITTAKSTSGNVEVTDSSSAVPFEAQSMSGNVVLRQVKAPRIEAASISGNVVIGQVEAPRIDAQSISGNVEFTSAFAKGGRYDFQSHSGTVRILVTGGSGFEIEASTFSGSIQADSALNLKTEGDESPRRRQRSLRGTHGDGSALVEASTFSGNVVLTKK